MNIKIRKSKHTIKVALKTKDGKNPSKKNPVYCYVDGKLKKINSLKNGVAGKNAGATLKDYPDGREFFSQ